MEASCFKLKPHNDVLGKNKQTNKQTPPPPKKKKKKKKMGGGGGGGGGEYMVYSTVARHANIETVPKATLRKLQKDEEERIRGFPNA